MKEREEKERGFKEGGIWEGEIQGHSSRGVLFLCAGIVCVCVYLSNSVLQFVVLFNVKACPLHSLVEEQEILSVSGIRVDVLLYVSKHNMRSHKTQHTVLSLRKKKIEIYQASLLPNLT